MPYITEAREDTLGDDFGKKMPTNYDLSVPTLRAWLLTLGSVLETKGDLNWAITQLMVGRLNRLGLSYGNISETCDGVENAADEGRRRLLSAYEDTKIAINPDPYAPLVAILEKLHEKT